MRTASFGTAAFLVASACATDAIPTTPQTPQRPQASVAGGCAGSQKPGGSAEGEVYGIIFENGQRTCNVWSVSLDPHPDAQSRLHMPTFKPELTADWKWANMWEFWDPLAGGPCKAATQTLADYLRDGSGTAEVAHAPPSPQEGHCVRPGRYAFFGAGRSFDVDYIQWSGRTILNTGTGQNEFIEAATYDGSDNGLWQDLVIHVDITTVHPGDTPVLEVQNAGADPYAGTFTDEAAPAGTAADWFRFSVMKSTSGWQIDTRGPALARLFFDGTDPSQATGYYSYIPENASVMRLHRFPNPATASKAFAVGLVLLRPDEEPEDPGPMVTRTVTITRINPDLAPGAISAPAAAALGSPMSITIAERNLGTNTFAPVEPNWTGQVYLSSDPLLSPASDRLVDTYVESSPIPANGTIQKQRQPVVPADLAPGTYYVLASLDANANVLESNEQNNVGASGSVNIGPPVVACAIFEGTTTWRMTDQLLRTKATCTSSGPNIRYRWQTDAGGPWTPYSTTSTYDFAGHSTAGSHTVTLEVSDVSSGLTATDVRTVTVQSGMISISGPREITVKGNYTYTASTASYWWERFVPSTTWTGGIGPQTIWTRTWTAGCYDVDVRADASGGGVLRRGRIQVNVTVGTCEGGGDPIP